MSEKTHWEQVYSTKMATAVSWFQQHAALSMQCLQDASVPTDAAIIDVGGGASTLVDDLLGQGYNNITVLDLAAAALMQAQQRLGMQAGRVQWREANVLEAALPQQAYDVWHDRAVFHFLTTDEAQQAYVQALQGALKDGGLLIMATFAEDGPAQCSGLPVARYSAQGLQAVLGTSFVLLTQAQVVHITPLGNEQKFLYCSFRKVAV